MGWRPWIFRKDDVGVLPNGMSRWLARRQFAAFGVMISVAIGMTLVSYLNVASGPTPMPLPTPTQVPVGAVPVTGVTPFWLMMAAPGVTILVSMFGLAYMFIAHRRAKRVVAETGGLLCPSCLYDLSGGAVEWCSECGQRVEYDALPGLWIQNTSVRGSMGGTAQTGFNKAGLSGYEVRARLWGFLLAVLVPLASFVPMQFFTFGSSGGSMPVRVLGSIGVPVLLMVVVLGPFLLFINRKFQRLKRALRESGGVACPRCLHDLSGAEVDRCPECEQRVDYATLGRLWAVRMKVLRIGSDGETDSVN